MFSFKFTLEGHVTHNIISPPPPTFYTVLSWTVSSQISYVEALTPEPKNVTV